jgi:hypothetical protein
MMAAIAAFAQSDRGKLFAAVHDRFGSDPGAGFTDEVLAYNLRAALMFNHPSTLELAHEDDEPADDWEAAGLENERAWLGG